MERLTFSDFKQHMEKYSITHGAIMNIGLDNMREINAAYGIEVGDEVLSVFSDIILKNSNAIDILRMENSDEFILLFDQLTRVAEGEHIFSKIQKCIAKACEGKTYFFTVSAGMVFFQNIGEQEVALLTCAEYALNRAKDQGKNCLFVYDKEQFVNYTAKMDLLQELKSSVQHNFEGFDLYYQPIISLETRKMKSAETLLRWNNPKYPKISPAEFIPVLEESGLMMEVGRFIIETAMKQVVKWKEFDPDFTLNINLSYVQFHQNNLAEQIKLCAEQNGVEPKQIIFEITESGFVGKKMIVSQQIKKMIDMGFQVALDDFGTGYSNFIYLKDMNFCTVKLDRVFTSEAVANNNKRELATHIVETVHSIGMKVCFEGVETAEDFRVLNELGPEYIQGYLFGMPAPAPVFQNFFDQFPNQELLDKIPKYKKSDASVAYLLNEMKEQEQIEKKNKISNYKLLSLFLPLLLITLLVLGIMNYRLNRDILRKQLDDSMTNSLEDSISVLKSKLEETEDLSRTIAIYVENSYKTIDLSNYETLLDEIVASNDEIAGAGIWFEHYAYQNRNVVCPYVYNHNGERILTYYYASAAYDYFSQEYYTKVKETRKPFITDPYFDPTMRSVIITFSYPIIDADDVFVGAATVDLYINNIDSIVKNLNPDENGQSFLLCSDGTVICGLTDFPQELKEKMQEDGGILDYHWENTNYVVYYDVLERTGWKTVVLFDTAGLYKPIQHMGLILVLTVILSIVAAMSIIIALIAAINRQKKLEFEQRKSLNEIHFKALQTSYHMIVVVDEMGEKVTSVYESPFVKQEKLVCSNYQDFIERNRKVIYKDDQELFLRFTSIFNLKDILSKKSFVSQEIRMNLEGNRIEWIEITASSITEPGEDYQNQQFLLMVRDIHAIKSKEILAQNEKMNLINQLQQKNEELFEMGITDSLTGIYNRKGLSYYSPAILDEAEKEGKKLFLLIADVNKLKQINDECGHLKGDEAIQEAARIISHTEFHSLIAARTGGDEFVLLGALPDEDEMPGRIMDKISRLLTESESDAIESGISMGYYWGKPAGDRKLDYYYEFADREMYIEKKKRKMNR